MRTLCVLSAALVLCAASGASEPATPRVTPDPLRDLNEQERAVWNSTIGYFCHAYVRGLQGDLVRVPPEPFEYIRGAIRWHGRYITVVGPQKIQQLENQLAQAKSQVVLGGTFGKSDAEIRAQAWSRQRVADLERLLREAREALRQRQVAYNQGDLVTLEALGAPALERFVVGEIGALTQRFTVVVIQDETTALASISMGGERFGIRLEGWPTADLVTDRSYTMDTQDRTGIVTGTRAYTTTALGTKTALVIRRVEVQDYLAGITQAEFIELLKTKGMTPLEFTHLVTSVRAEKPDTYVDEVLRRLEAPPTEAPPTEAPPTEDDQQKTTQDG
jgi:hypothetical protein